MARDDDDKEQGPDGAGGGAIDLYDGVLAAALIAFCAFFYWRASLLPDPPSFLGEAVPASLWPQVLLIFIGLMALLLPIEHRLEPERWPLIKKARSAPIGVGVWITIGFLAALLAAAPWTGTVLTIFFAALLLPLLWGERRYGLVAAYATIFTGVVTYVFSIVLSVYFVPGVFNLTLR